MMFDKADRKELGRLVAKAKFAGPLDRDDVERLVELAELPGAGVPAVGHGNPD